MKNISNIKTGALGEKYTCKYLRRNKYRNKYAEIDIIAENREYILFVEVKTRRSTDIIPPAASVDLKKQQRIIKAAKYYLSYSCKNEKQPRFDIAEVTMNDKGKCCKINYIENAYSQGGDYAVF